MNVEPNFQSINSVAKTCHQGDTIELMLAFSRATDSSSSSDEVRLFRLLAQVCSMSLHMARALPTLKRRLLQYHSEVASAGLTQDDIEMLTAAYPKIEDTKLRGRVAEVVWVTARPKNVEHAREAIRAFAAIPLAYDRWTDWLQCIEHALALAGQIRDTSDLRSLQGSLLEIIERPESHPSFRINIARALIETGVTSDQSVRLSSDLRLSARAHQSAGEHARAIAFLRLAVDALKKTADQSIRFQTIAALAEALASESAELVLRGQAPDLFRAHSGFRNAIDAYREIPRTARDGEIATRISELERLMTSVGKSAASSVPTFKAVVDVSDVAELARAMVRGRSKTDALAELARIGSAIQLIPDSRAQEASMMGMFAPQILSNDGRLLVVARSEHTSHDAGDDPISIGSLLEYSQAIDLVAQGLIRPALTAVCAEHEISEEDCISITARSSYAPPASHRLIGQGLCAGFKGDMVSAIHILAPQIECVVRSRLQNSGASTTTLDPRGPVMHVALGALLTRPEAVPVLGRELVFELRALFCEQGGPNLRNDVAHGLISYERCYSPSSLYAWWFLLRLIVLSPN